jgi:two-component system cell cycle sensor histidine kinase/response regulator CckA
MLLMTQMDDARGKPGGRVLVVDGDPEVRDYITRLLSDRWAITTVADGRAALRTAHEQPPDLVISDVMTPGLDGMGLLRALRADPLSARIPVVLLSTRAGEESRIEALEAGADDYLVQPFSDRELVARVESTIALARLREQSEAAVRVSEERYRAFIEQSSEGVWRIEVDGPVPVTLPAEEQIDRFYAYGRLAECNDAMARMYGFEHASELVGATLAELVPRSDPANLAFIRAFIAANYRLYDAESHETDRHGNPRYFLNNFVGILEEGHVVRAWGTQRDVTDRKLAEEDRRATAQALASVVAASPAAIIGTDHAGNVTFWSRAAERMFGWPAAEAIGRPFPLTPVRTDEPSQSEPAGALSHPGVTEFQTQVQRGDGTYLDVSVSTAALTGTDGAMTGAVAVVLDTTDRKVAEERLRQAQRMEAVGRLAGGMAHEANNQMSVVLGSVAFILSRGDLADEVREDVEQIQRAAERTAGVTTQLLAFSRRQVLQIQWLDLNTVVAGMESTLRRTMGEEVSVLLRINQVTGSIVADPSQLEQVLLNLALNARDAMPSGGRLSIETGTTILTEAYARLKPGVSITPGAYAVLAVTDTGHGMDRETLAHAFEPFFTTKGLGKGTGLGLSTVYGFVKQSGGYVWAYSEPGQGTVVKVYLPLVDLPAETGTPTWPSGQNAVVRRTVLVVEDEPQVRRMAARALAEVGHRVLEAADGREAITVLSRAGQGVDLVLTDVAMPGMSGRELADRLHIARPDVRVIFMSGYADDEIVRRGLLGPDQPFIQKPFTPATLVRRIAELTEQWLPSPSLPTS